MNNTLPQTHGGKIKTNLNLLSNWVKRPDDKVLVNIYVSNSVKEMDCKRKCYFYEGDDK